MPWLLPGFGVNEEACVSQDLLDTPVELTTKAGGGLTGVRESAAARLIDVGGVLVEAEKTTVGGFEAVRLVTRYARGGGQVSCVGSVLVPRGGQTLVLRVTCHDLEHSGAWRELEVFAVYARQGGDLAQWCPQAGDPFASGVTAVRTPADDRIWD